MQRSASPRWHDASVKRGFLTATLLLALALASCKEDPRMCNGKFMPSGVGIDVKDLPALRTATTVRLCVADDCQSGDAPQNRLSHIRAGRKLTGKGPYRVTLELRDQAGRVLYAGRGSAALKRVEPYGKGCGYVWIGGVRANPDGTLADIG